MHPIQIVEFPDAHPLKRFTFTINGLPTLYSCATRAAAERVAGRLAMGRSGEAFGGAGLTASGARVGYAALDGGDRKARARVVQDGEVVTETVEAKSGRQKVREKRPGYLVDLDGKVYEGGTTAEGAKGVAAVQAFLTRGKLGLKDEARAAFKDKTGKDCKVHHFGHKLVAKDADGGLWWVGVALGKPLTEKYTFKPLAGAGQLKLGAEIGGLALREKR